MYTELIQNLEQVIAAAPMWLRLIPATVAGLGLVVGIWTTRDRVR